MVLVGEGACRLTQVSRSNSNHRSLFSILLKGKKALLCLKLCKISKLQ